MESGKFRKLDTEVQMQPNVNQKPWLMAGFLLAILIIIMSAYAYFHKEEKAVYRSIEKAK